MRDTMVLPVILLLVGSASCLAVKRRARSAAEEAEAAQLAASPPGSADPAAGAGPAVEAGPGAPAAAEQPIR
jgi:hypothetical protein